MTEARFNKFSMFIGKLATSKGTRKRQSTMMTQEQATEFLKKDLRTK